jgi:hypothetical protein
MTNNIDTVAKEIGSKIIAISEILSEKLTTWSTFSVLPNKLGETECVGFVNKPDAKEGHNVIVDLIAPRSEQNAVLRTWVISSKEVDSNELYNNIQLNFSLPIEQAHLVAAKKGAVSRTDLDNLLHSEGTHVTRVIVSDGSGIDHISKDKIGQRYDILTAELKDEEEGARVVDSLNNVIARLQISANSEINP